MVVIEQSCGHVQSDPYDGFAFDDVVASLVLHYLRDWTAPLAELKRAH